MKCQDSSTIKCLKCKRPCVMKTNILIEVALHIKKTYLYFRQDINESVGDFYTFYEKNHENPFVKLEVGKIMSILGIKSFHKSISLNRKKLLYCGTIFHLENLI